jgi:hypothetical protein
MALLKKMFETQPDNIPLVPLRGVEERTYQEWGHIKAGLCNGQADNLQPCLQAVYIQVRQKIEHEDDEQEKRKIPLRKEKEGLEAENKNLDIVIRDEKDKLHREESKIEDKKKEIADIKENPIEKIRELKDESPSKIGFWIGTLIVALLTVYLFIFYSSAAYSAFFKNFTPDDTNIVNSIFDAKAIEKALIDGLTELILILTIPAVFLGLGFLIHKFNEQKGISKYFKIGGLVATTFIFDFILAYEIVEKIYEIKRQGSFQDMPIMTVNMAFQQINFWLIIFAGFVVYIIWGFIFDLVMLEHGKLDKIKNAIRRREKLIADYKIECKNIKQKISDAEQKKNSNSGRIKQLDIELEGVIVFFNDVKKEINNFFTGWLNYMSGVGKSTVEITKCTGIKDGFLTELQKNYK